jgi:hypothetical protein
MRALFLVVFLMGGHLALGQGGTSTKLFAGCYELHFEGWHPIIASSSMNDFLPKRFQLTTQPFKPKWFVARNLDAKVREGLPLSSWNVKDDGRLEIVWSTGFVGWDIELGGSGANLRGTARYFTDTDPHPSDPIKVAAHSVGCKDLAH